MTAASLILLWVSVLLLIGQAWHLSRRVTRDLRELDAAQNLKRVRLWRRVVTLETRVAQADMALRGPQGLLAGHANQLQNLRDQLQLHLGLAHNIGRDSGLEKWVQDLKQLETDLAALALRLDKLETAEERRVAALAERKALRDRQEEKIANMTRNGPQGAVMSLLGRGGAK
ncbi:MAG: hypothetical protein PHU85_00325 [Phycisphaerae bacterium]|nr:hypothetical protein [Phycisphaerae bacterium]